MAKKVPNRVREFLDTVRQKDPQWWSALAAKGVTGVGAVNTILGFYVLKGGDWNTALVSLGVFLGQEAFKRWFGNLLRQAQKGQEPTLQEIADAVAGALEENQQVFDALVRQEEAIRAIRDGITSVLDEQRERGEAMDRGFEQVLDRLHMLVASLEAGGRKPIETISSAWPAPSKARDPAPIGPAPSVRLCLENADPNVGPVPEIRLSPGSGKTLQRLVAVVHNDSDHTLPSFRVILTLPPELKADTPHCEVARGQPIWQDASSAAGVIVQLHSGRDCPCYPHSKCRLTELRFWSRAGLRYPESVEIPYEIQQEVGSPAVGKTALWVVAPGGQSA